MVNVRDTYGTSFPFFMEPARLYFITQLAVLRPKWYAAFFKILNKLVSKFADDKVADADIRAVEAGSGETQLLVWCTLHLLDCLEPSSLPSATSAPETKVCNLPLLVSASLTTSVDLGLLGFVRSPVLLRSDTLGRDSSCHVCDLDSYSCSILSRSEKMHATLQRPEGGREDATPRAPSLRRRRIASSPVLP